LKWSNIMPNNISFLGSNNKSNPFKE